MVAQDCENAVDRLVHPLETDGAGGEFSVTFKLVSQIVAYSNNCIITSCDNLPTKGRPTFSVSFIVSTLATYARLHKSSSKELKVVPFKV